MLAGYVGIKTAGGTATYLLLCEEHNKLLMRSFAVVVTFCGVSEANFTVVFSATEMFHPGEKDATLSSSQSAASELTVPPKIVFIEDVHLVVLIKLCPSVSRLERI